MQIKDRKTIQNLKKKIEVAMKEEVEEAEVLKTMLFMEGEILVVLLEGNLVVVLMKIMVMIMIIIIIMN